MYLSMGSVCMYYVCICTYVFVYQRVFFVVCYNVTNLIVRSKPGNRRSRPDLDSCSQLAQYTSDSKTDPWNDPVIRTGSHSEDQTVIRIQDRVISCEYLLLCYFLIYRGHRIFVFYLYYFMWLF